MAKSVRIWQKKQLRLDLLTFRQRDMVKIGAAGLLAVKKRVSQARGPTDAPAKPLTVPYARYKSRMRKGRYRDLKFTGKMLGNVSLRTVSDNMAKASLTSRKQRIKAFANQKREPWLLFSPANRLAVMQIARKVFAEAKARMIRLGNID
ncbi:MAG: hypothetical protein JW730_18190 [Anaerolineales bacterium]|nr:hypothetical protein [Anaerolineales bacterium]